MQVLTSYLEEAWRPQTEALKTLHHAADSTPLYQIPTQNRGLKEVLSFGRKQNGLRDLPFHERALRLKALAKYLFERKNLLYPLAHQMGATKRDAWIDIDGGIGTLFTYASKGRRELPNETYFLDGPAETVSPKGGFAGRHICVPLEGVAIHINAFNFPCWGMLEKLAPTWLAGMPAIVKPASSTSYLAHRLTQLILESKILPPGSLQLIMGPTGDLFDHLSCQDVVTFTGSHATGITLKGHRRVLEKSVRFNMEADSLNFSLLGPKDGPSSPEYKGFLKEVLKEMTSKTGQKCTAIRRIFVPQDQAGQVAMDLKAQLEKVVIGHPTDPKTRMGPLVGLKERQQVFDTLQLLKQDCQVLYERGEDFPILGGDFESGAYMAPTLLMTSDPHKKAPHQLEAFGPVATIIPYKDDEEAIELIKRGEGSLVGSLFSEDKAFARKIIMGTAAYHGRLLHLDRDSMLESTGHGSPLPHFVHGGPGRAGGGEELGGIRSVMHYMQKTALQGHPDSLTYIGREWVKEETPKRPSQESFWPAEEIHPFRLHFEDLKIGQTLITHRRTLSEADIVNFAGISGDYYYAHMDQLAVPGSLFQARVAHGYFLVAAAAGLFVSPAPGPVLANYGLENLRFIKPVYIGDTIYVKLTVKSKTRKEKKEDMPLNGVVNWHVDIFNQHDEVVANYSILTLVKRKEEDNSPSSF